MQQRKALLGLKPQSYEHALDRQALDALEKTGGLKTLVGKVNEWGLERMLRVQLTGSHLRVGADTDPELHALLQDAARCIDLPLMPELYVAATGELNAFTSGVRAPIVVLSAEMVDAFSAKSCSSSSAMSWATSRARTSCITSSPNSCRCSASCWAASRSASVNSPAPGCRWRC